MKAAGRAASGAGSAGGAGEGGSAGAGGAELPAGSGASEVSEVKGAEGVESAGSVAAGGAEDPTSVLFGGATAGAAGAAAVVSGSAGAVGVPRQAGPGGRSATAGSPASRQPALSWDAPAPGDEATRYLCAAAHVDPVFARRALREFVFDDGRAPAPASGVDEILVLRHCLAARARRLHRDAALLALVVIALLVSVWTVAAWLVWGAGLRVLLSGQRWAGLSAAEDSAGSAGPAGSVAQAGEQAEPPGPLARFAALLWGVGGAAAVLAASGVAHPFGWRVGARWQTGPGSPLISWVFVPAAAFGTAWLVVLAERLAARHVLVDRLRRDRFGTHRWVSTETMWARRALAELAARPGADRQVLADPARPFAGSGRQVLRRRWLLETGPIRFDVEDLVERVTEALAAGVPGLGPDGLLDAVVWDDFVVATGPVLVTGQTHDASLRLLSSGRGAASPRVFRRFQILSDPAENVVTVYLTGSAAPGLALIELHGLVLEPVAAAYRRVDRLAGLGPWALAVEAWRAAVALPGLVLGSAAAAIGTALDPVRRRHRRAVLDRAAAGGLAAASGARTSLRELGVAERGGRGPLVDREGAPFAREDANLALAVVERRVREALRPLI